MNIYGRDGQPMELEEFQKIPAKKRILKDKTLVIDGGPMLVRTSWDGVDASDGESPVPLIFTTYVLAESRPVMRMATPDEKKAMVAHEMMIGFAKSQGASSNPAKITLAMLRNPRTLWAARLNTILYSLIVLMQAVTLTMSAIFWDWDWDDAFTTVIAGIYAWLAICAGKKWREYHKERAEEQRIEKEREEFDRITGQLKGLGTLDE